MYKIEQSIPKELEYAEKLVLLMDGQFKIPFFNFRFGLDPIIGLIPMAGDIVSFIISALIIVALAKNGLPSKVVFKMVWNILLDLLVGGIPIIGDAWDFFNKANRKNLKLARKHFETQSGK
ncbi:MAG: DUF4112 domain-containing protein [Flavobacteriales bacterium]|nr:DUF4112 domain-containing protein [Flavobacteriales bacterium]